MDKIPIYLRIPVDPLTPKSCPFPSCGDPTEVDIVPSDDGKEWFVMCGGCAMNGPSFKLESDAVIAWDLLPRREDAEGTMTLTLATALAKRAKAEAANDQH